MTKPDKHPFRIGTISGGRIAAISTSSPYFCFVGASVEEVEHEANEALNFYFEASGHIVAGESPAISAKPQKSGFRELAESQQH